MKRTALVRTVVIVFGTVVALVTIHGMGAVAGQSEAARPETDERTTCSTASLRGTFGFTATGTFAGLPVARAGLETFDGKGHASGTATTSVNGTISDHSTFTTTYIVKHNCTGTFQETDSAIGTSDDEFVIVDGGREIQAVNVDPGGVITAVWKKQFPKDDRDQ